MNIETSIVYGLLFVSLYFEVFLLISFITHKKEKSQTQDNTLKYKDSELPTVTITVPCYNEEKTLAGTITSLLDLNYPKHKLCITVVNDGSTDTTLSIAQKFAAQYPQVTVHDKKNGGKASAMNLALGKSTSELIGCLDADSFVKPDALRLIAAHFIKDSSISAVTPAIMIHNPKNILQMMQRAEYMVGIFMRKVFSMLDSIVVTPGPFSIFRRADILTVGPWRHAHGTEDFEMGLRLQSLHKKIANEPRAQVLTISPSTVYSLYRQRIRWVYGFLMNVLDYKYMVGNARYSNVGIFVLPTALVSIFGAVYLFVLMLMSITSTLYDMFIRIYTVGAAFEAPSIELFYINTSALLFIVAAIIGIVLVILHHSAQLSTTKVYKKDTALYLLLYGMLAPLWLTSAVARALVGKESAWRVIR